MSCRVGRVIVFRMVCCGSVEKLLLGEKHDIEVCVRLRGAMRVGACEMICYVCVLRVACYVLLCRIFFSCWVHIELCCDTTAVK